MTGLVSCSSDGGGNTANGSGTPEIVVGNIGTYSGPTASSQAQAQDMAKAWASWVNAHGGINGRRVRLVVMDDGGNATTALSQVKKLVEQEHVVAVIGNHSNSDVNWASYISGTDVPVIGGTSLDLPFVTNPSFFPVGPSVIAGLYGVLQIAKAKGPKMGLLYCAEAPQCASAVPLYTTLAKALGLSIPYNAKVAASAPDYTSQCQGLKEAGVQSVSVLAPSDTVVRVHRACADQGINVPEVAQDGTVTTSWLKEPSLNGMRAVGYVAPFYDRSIPATREFHDAIQQYAPGIEAVLSEQSADVWASGKLFEAAVRAAPAGELTATAVKKGLYSLRDETLGGLTVPLNFVAGKPTSIKCWFTMGIEDGAFVGPNGLATQCAPASVVDPVVATLG
ncbi:ABC transporter substrate-binding protein [Frankia sp. CiP1_Cm_nod2]|uniref:ABC transporter substrate-binding protein n=1 Tax=Frankia sp. CiP1_Cm_nod2 TaxID=2897161 RepID=UPI00202543E2